MNVSCLISVGLGDVRGVHPEHGQNSGTDN